MLSRCTARDTSYGLAATAWINCRLVFDHAVPFGGYKQSGWGHEFGQEGIDAYLKTKSVWAQL